MLSDHLNHTHLSQLSSCPASPENLPVATKLAEQVLCLPMYAELTDEDVERILQVVLER